MKKRFVGLAVLALAVTPVVWSQTQSAQELDIKEIIAKLESAGYTKIRDIERDDGLWEVEATNSAGRRVELHIDPVSGKVLYEELEGFLGLSLGLEARDRRLVAGGTKASAREAPQAYLCWPGRRAPLSGCRL
jgi:hypothetical protein